MIIVEDIIHSGIPNYTELVINSLKMIKKIQFIGQSNRG